jgi:hypothetical protein
MTKQRCFVTKHVSKASYSAVKCTGLRATLHELKRSLPYAAGDDGQPGNRARRLRSEDRRTRHGGPPATAVKNDPRAGLLGMLRQLAGYVQINCNNDMATLLSSGFQAMSTNRAQAQLEQPIGLVLQNGTSGQLVGSVNPVKNVSLYEGRIKGPTAIGSRQC